MKKVGDYVLTHKLGEGSFGLVHKAINIKTEEAYAAKALEKVDYSKKQKQLDDLSMLKIEIRILAKLDHMNILHMHDVLETKKYKYMLLDYCEKGNLEDLIKVNKHLGENDATYLLMQILNGFRELHRWGIIHRDFKPQNILLTSDFRCIIADFGLSHAETPTAMKCAGTMAFMAPEVLKCATGSTNPYDNRVDIWSIAITVYFMLFGQFPYPISLDSLEMQNFISLKCGNNLPFLENEKLTISEDMKDLLRKMTIWEPENRIKWDDIFKHPLFAKFIENKVDERAADVIIQRKWHDRVVREFMHNATNDLHAPTKNFLESDDVDHRTEEEKNEARIKHYFEHEHQVRLFMTNTAKLVRLLSKEKPFEPIFKYMWMAGLMLIKKVNLLNSNLIQLLETRTVTQGVQGLLKWDSFWGSQQHKKKLEEVKSEYGPEYKILLERYMHRYKIDLERCDPSIRSAIILAQSPSQEISSGVNLELKLSIQKIIEFFRDNVNTLEQSEFYPLTLRVIRNLYFCYNHHTRIPHFERDLIPFEWKTFLRNWEINCPPKRSRQEIDSIKLPL
jgi:serine/threonine protein kinase